MTLRVCTRCGNDVPERFAPEITVCFVCRCDDVTAADEEFDPRQWFLFFTGNDGLLGGCVVEARGMLDAVTTAHELGINPGGQVEGLPVADVNVGLLPTNTFLTPDDLAEPPFGWVDMTPRAVEFVAWCTSKGIHLTIRQIEAASAILDGMTVLQGRGAGKTFLLNQIDEFINEQESS